MCGPEEPSWEDLKEVQRFRDFLQALSHLPPRRKRTLQQEAEAARIYQEHYPEYAQRPETD
jgi:hypothetical protein